VTTPRAEAVALTPRPLTVAQKRAIRSIEGAFVRAARANLAVCGMDDSLYAYHGGDFDRLRDEGRLPSAYEIQRALIEQSTHIDTSGVYRESGGW